MHNTIWDTFFILCRSCSVRTQPDNGSFAFQVVNCNKRNNDIVLRPAQLVVSVHADVIAKIRGHPKPCIAAFHLICYNLSRRNRNEYELILLEPDTIT